MKNMKTKIPFLITLALLFLPLTALAQEDFKLGGNYMELPAPATRINPDDARLEVTLFLWYGCGACSLVDPIFEAWAEEQPEDVATRVLPTTWVEPWNMHARIFMTLEEMGLEKDLHRKVFETFKTREGMPRSEDDLPAFAKAMGLDPETFMKTYKSKEVSGRMEWLDGILKVYNPDAVPAIVVDGRYLTNLGLVEDPSRFMELTGQLVEKVRQEKAAEK
ncbi:hypothetical protein C4J81_17065 [Deltaproteobacteria bacterium Smac51]|nr:hypothetical protein C4J81_17065 [Deltaproteobacteria bacterium Smac51]